MFKVLDLTSNTILSDIFVRRNPLKRTKLFLHPLGYKTWLLIYNKEGYATTKDLNTNFIVIVID